MQISSITLQNFRSFTKASFNFSDTTTVIIGPNGIGKTNLLEAIYLLATGKSFRAGFEEEMINASREFARIQGIVNSEQSNKLEVILTRGHVGGEKVGRKKLLMNGLVKRLVDFAGNLKVVLFGPWDMGLITDSPSVRRRFLDTVLLQVDREYRRAALSYEKGLRARNKLLERIRDEGASRGQLIFWNQLLIKNGDYISRKRDEFIQFVNSSFQLHTSHFQLEYDKSAISEARLEQYAQEEVAAAATLVGPHRDNVKFQISNFKFQIKRDLAVYGSRGEQRMCVLWVKLAELAFVQQVSGDKPVLLLDDIFSELDHEHREIVVEMLERHQTPLRPTSSSTSRDSAGQAILTTADPHTVAGLKKARRIELD